MSAYNKIVPARVFADVWNSLEGPVHTRPNSRVLPCRWALIVHRSSLAARVVRHLSREAAIKVALQAVRRSLELNGATAATVAAIEAAEAGKVTDEVLLAAWAASNEALGSDDDALTPAAAAFVAEAVRTASDSNAVFLAAHAVSSAARATARWNERPKAKA